MPDNCRYGVISDGCTGFWGWGQTERSAVKHTRQYFRGEIKSGRIYCDEFERLETMKQKIDFLMADCWVEVVNIQR